jgi:hypothetical protein
VSRRAVCIDDVAKACAIQGVEFISSRKRPGKGWLIGPADGAFRVAEGVRQVWMPERAWDGLEPALWALHELAHVVFWHEVRRQRMPEEFFMPWEVAVLRWAGGSRALYFSSAYTLETVVRSEWIGETCRDTVSDWKRPGCSAWYRRAFADNLAAGTIDERGLPTWRMPDLTRVDLGWYD